MFNERTQLSEKFPVAICTGLDSSGRKRLLGFLFGHGSMLAVCLLAIRVLPLQPFFELRIFVEYESERFRNDVDSRGTKELRVLLQLRLEILINTKLQRCILRLFWWCFQNWHLVSPSCMPALIKRACELGWFCPYTLATSCV